MKLQTRALAALALTALALSGCSADTEQTRSPDSSGVINTPLATAATEPANSRITEASSPDSSGITEPAPATDVDTDGPRSAERLDQYLTTLNRVYNDNAPHSTYTGEREHPFKTLEEYRECAPGDPGAYLDSIESPRPGELIVTLMPDAWGGGEYDPGQVNTVPYLAGILHGYIRQQTDELQKLTATTPDGAHQATEGRLPKSERTDTPQTEAELQDWADARFQDWLRAMNFTYRDLCGGVESVADYWQCVPDDPHGYITSMEAPAAGELVVHVENGAWQGGPYEPAAPFVSSNMVLKIGSYSNDVDSLTVETENGQSYTSEYNPR